MALANSPLNYPGGGWKRHITEAHRLPTFIHVLFSPTGAAMLWGLSPSRLLIFICKPSHVIKHQAISYIFQLSKLGHICKRTSWARRGGKKKKSGRIFNLCGPTLFRCSIDHRVYGPSESMLRALDLWKSFDQTMAPKWDCPSMGLLF